MSVKKSGNFLGPAEGKVILSNRPSLEKFMGLNWSGSSHSGKNKYDQQDSFRTTEKQHYLKDCGLDFIQGYFRESFTSVHQV